MMSERSNYMQPKYQSLENTAIHMHTLYDYKEPDDFLIPEVCEACKFSNTTVVPPVFVTCDPDKSEPDKGGVKLVLLGEAPGATEDKYGFPFIGKAGEVLFSALEDAFDGHIPDMLIMNSVWCRPPKNKTPTQSQIRLCAQHHLVGQLLFSGTVDEHALIVALGGSAWKAMHLLIAGLPKPGNISTNRGVPKDIQITLNNTKFLDRDFSVAKNLTLFGTFHPASVFYTPQKLSLFANDILKIAGLATGEITSEPKTLEPSYTIYEKDLSLSDIDDILSTIRESGTSFVTHDIETHHKDHHKMDNDILCCGIAYSPTQAIEFSSRASSKLGMVFSSLKKEGYLVVNHNYKFDVLGCWNHRMFRSWEDIPKFHDTKTIRHLIDENGAGGAYRLKTLLMRELNIDDYSVELDRYLSENKIKDYGSIPTDVLYKYNARDVCGNYQYYEHLMERFENEKELKDTWIVDYIEYLNNLDRHLLRMTLNGIKVDVEYIRQLDSELSKQLKDLREWFQTLHNRKIATKLFLLNDADLKKMVFETWNPLPEEIEVPDDLEALRVFNPGSTDQLHAWMAETLPKTIKKKIFQAVKNRVIPRTEGDNVSLGKETLATIRELVDGVKNKTKTHNYVLEFIDKVIEYKAMQKLHSTYVVGMLNLTWPDGMIRSQYSVAGPVTGRLSSSNPNGQNIVNDNKIKRMFIPRDSNHIFISPDLAQAEVRGFATISKCERLTEAIRSGTDIHRLVASRTYGIPYDDIDKKDPRRQAAKSTVFGTLYGNTAKGLSTRLKIPVNEAQQLIDGFLDEFPGSRNYFEKIKKDVTKQKYVLGGLGRKRHLSTIVESQEDEIYREAINHPVQNLASEFNMHLYIYLEEMFLEELRSIGFCEPVQTVHDSLVYELDYTLLAKFIETYFSALKYTNEHFEQLYKKKYKTWWVWMEADFKVGNHMGDMHEITGKESYKELLELLERTVDSNGNTLCFNHGLASRSAVS